MNKDLRMGYIKLFQRICSTTDCKRCPVKNECKELFPKVLPYNYHSLDLDEPAFDKLAMKLAPLENVACVFSEYDPLGYGEDDYE